MVIRQTEGHPHLGLSDGLNVGEDFRGGRSRTRRFHGHLSKFFGLRSDIVQQRGHPLKKYARSTG
jgi:hypothetical protein